MKITVTVNGQERSAEVEPRLLLVHFLREKLRLTGTHIGCDTTSCGACTVLLDGTPVKSCTMFAVQADGREITMATEADTDAAATDTTTGTDATTAPADTAAPGDAAETESPATN